MYQGNAILGNIQLERKKRLAEVYNAKKILEAVEQVVKEPKETLNSLKREEFKSDLKQINSRMRRMR